MAEKITSEAVLKYIENACNTIKRYCSSMYKTAPADKKVIIDNTDEFYSYFKNAVESSDPFAQNVEAMRAQGLWLPEKINNSSVKAAYFNLSKGYCMKIVNNEAAVKILHSSDRDKISGVHSVVNNINKYIDEIIKGEKIIEN